MAAINQTGGAPRGGELLLPIPPRESASLDSASQFSRDRQRGAENKPVDFRTVLDRSQRESSPKGNRNLAEESEAENFGWVPQVPAVLPPVSGKPVVPEEGEAFLLELPLFQQGNNAADFAYENVVQSLANFAELAQTVPAEESRALSQGGMGGALHRAEAPEISPAPMPVLNTTTTETFAGLSAREVSVSDTTSAELMGDLRETEAVDNLFYPERRDRQPEPLLADGAKQPLEVEEGDLRQVVAPQIQLTREKRPFQDPRSVREPARGGSVPVATDHIRWSGARPEAPEQQREEVEAAPVDRPAAQPRNFLGGNLIGEEKPFSDRNESSGQPLFSAGASVGEGAPVYRGEEAKAPSRTEAVTALFQQITDAIQRMRTNNRTNVEMQVQLNDGQELVVKLNFVNGEVRATFRTDSTELRHALESHWTQFATQSAEKGIRVAAAQFEGQPNLGMHDHRHASDHRQSHREAAEAQQEFLSFLGRTARPAGSAPQPTATLNRPETDAGWAAYA